MVGRVVACIEGGADVNAYSIRGRTALMIVAGEGFCKIVRFLLVLLDMKGNATHDPE